MNEPLISTLLETPYIAGLGVKFDHRGDELTGCLPFRDDLVGNPLIPAPYRIVDCNRIYDSM